MYRNTRIFSLGCAAAAAICASTLIAHVGAREGRFLSESEMAAVLGGTGPPCTHHEFYMYCFDAANCLGRSGLNCLAGGQCDACTGDSLNSWCMTTLPHDIKDCQEFSDPGSCGKWLDHDWSSCDWDAEALRCNCKGPVTTLDCSQRTVTSNPNCEGQGS